MSSEVWQWRGAGGGARVSFSGCLAEAADRHEVFHRLTGAPDGVAWVHQVHGAQVVDAGAAGACGEGDALVARTRGLALAIVTADCVPVLLAGPRGIAAAHAGWRGIVAGVVGAALAELGGSPAECVAWIGPAIGPCCYETGPEVAAQIAAASHDAAVSPGPVGRPHVDLRLAVRHQLATAGVERVEVVDLCTRCAAGLLHSYRRDGRGAGRNHSFIWLA